MDSGDIVSDTIDAPQVDPVEDGQVGDVGGTPDVADDAPILNVEEFSDHHVTVKVDGQDVRVPLSEAVAGYSRQADYTRKTQELAEQRQQLQWASAIAQALENDPKQTINLLQTHYGLSKAEAQQVANQATAETQEAEWADPVEARVKELDERIRQFEEDRAYQQLQQEVARLQNTYGDDFNPQEVVSQALATGSTNLEAVYKQIAYDRLVARVQAAERLAGDRTAQEQAVLDAKRGAGVVAGGSGAAGEGQSESAPIRSVSDAWNAAKREYGVA